MDQNNISSPSNLNGKKILVVDDEPDILTYLTVLMENNGYKTYQAQNAVEALKTIQETKPDLISLDIMMPKKSGIAFYRELKLNHETSTTPVIFISAFSMARDFTGPGFRKLIPELDIPEPDGYLEKPVDIPRLLELINKILG